MASPLTRRFAATALLAALALPALAQNAPLPAAGENAPGATQQRAPRDAGRMRESMQQRMEQRHARHLAELKASLQLTPAQEGAWTDFTKAMQPPKRPTPMDRQALEQLSTPERIDRMRTLRAERAAEADRHGEATKAFYATLTPAQQKTFDQQTLRQHRHGGPRDGKGGGHHHGMHGMHGMRGMQ